MHRVRKKTGVVVFFIVVIVCFVPCHGQQGKGPGGGGPPGGGGAPPPPDGGGPPPQDGGSSTPPTSPGQGVIDDRCYGPPCTTDRQQYWNPVPNNCTMYYKCAGNSAPKPQSCNPGELFNKFTNTCVSNADQSVCLTCPSTASSSLNPSQVSTNPSSQSLSTNSSLTTQSSVSSTKPTTYSSTTTIQSSTSTSSTTSSTSQSVASVPSSTAQQNSTSTPSTTPSTLSAVDSTTTRANNGSTTTVTSTQNQAVSSTSTGAAISMQYNSSSITVDNFPSVSTPSSLPPVSTSVTQSSVSSAANPLFQRSISMSAPPSNMVIDGSTVQFDCSYIWKTPLAGIAYVDMFFWILNGKQLETTGRIVIAPLSGPSPNGYYKSSISFNPVLSSDSGNLTCAAVTGGYLNITSYIYQVLAKPIVTISPGFQTLNYGQPLLINCTASLVSSNNSLSLEDIQRVTIMADGHMIDNDYLVSLNSSAAVVYTFNYTSSASINCSCFVETPFVNISSSVAFVRVLTTVVGSMCQNETMDAVSWETTTPGGSDIRPCPNGGSGLAVRQCSMSSQWNLPDFSGCISQKFINLTNKVDAVKNRNGALDNTTLTNLSNDIANTVKTTENMTRAEMMLCVGIVSTMADIHASSSPNLLLAKPELLNMMQTVDLLIKSSYWNKVPKNFSVSLLTSVNVYTTMYQSDIFVIYENMVLETDVTTKMNAAMGTMDSQFPSWGNVNWTMENAGFWSGASDNLITLNRQTTANLMQSATPRMNFSSSCIRNLGSYMPLTESQKNESSFINSYIISLTISGLSENVSFNPPIIITAQHLQPVNKSYSAQCVFWKFSASDNGSWSTGGCQTMSSNETHTLCNCTHLTNFAILMSPFPATNMDDIVLSIISMVGCIISVIALILTVLLYLSQWKHMKSKRAAVLINLCIALIVANIVFLAGSSQTQSEVGCKVVAVLLHYFFLVAFFMMLLEGIMLLIYIVFIFYVHRMMHTIIMIVLAWFIPAVIVAITLGVTKTGGYGTKTTCWLSVDKHVLWAFVAPALFIILANLIIIVIVLSRIASSKVRSDLKKKRNKVMSVLRNVLILSPILGITWIFGVLSVNNATVVFQYIFAITNSLQGLFIFVLHGLCHPKNKKKTSTTSKERQTRWQGGQSRTSIHNHQIPLTGTDSQEDLVQKTKSEQEMHGEKEIIKQNSVYKTQFGHQLSNISQASNGTALTYMSNTSSSNGKTNSSIGNANH